MIGPIVQLAVRAIVMAAGYEIGRRTVRVVFDGCSHPRPGDSTMPTLPPYGSDGYGRRIANGGNRVGGYLR